MSKIICVLAFALPGQAIQAQKSDGIGDDEIKSLIKFATTQAKYAASQAIHAASQVTLAREQYKAAQAQVKVADQQKNFANMVLAYVQSFAAKVMELFVLANKNINAWFKTIFWYVFRLFCNFSGSAKFRCFRFCNFPRYSWCESEIKETQETEFRDPEKLQNHLKTYQKMICVMFCFFF